MEDDHVEVQVVDLIAEQMPQSWYFHGCRPLDGTR